MIDVELRPASEPASAPAGWVMRSLSATIALVLAIGIAAAGFGAGDGAGRDVATAQDLRLIQSSATAVEALDAIEISIRVEFDGQAITMEGAGSATDGRFEVSIPGLDDFTLIQIGTTAYLPAFAQPGWSEFIGPPGMAPEATATISGQDPLAYLQSISGEEEIEIRGRHTVDGVEVTRYHVEVDLVDALRAAEANLGDLGIPEDEITDLLTNASPMQLDIDIDDAGIPRWTQIVYEVQGIDFDIETEIRPVDAAPVVAAPPDSEIVSSHTATDVTHYQQLIGSHLAQYAVG